MARACLVYILVSASCLVSILRDVPDSSILAVLSVWPGAVGSGEEAVKSRLYSVRLRGVFLGSLSLQAEFGNKSVAVPVDVLRSAWGLVLGQVRFLPSF